MGSSTREPSSRSSTATVSVTDVYKRQILEAAVHIQHLAGGPGGVVAAQIGDSGGHVAQFAHPLEADAGGQRFDTVLGHAGEHLSLQGAGGHAVHRDLPAMCIRDRYPLLSDREMAALGYQWDTQAVPPCGEPSDSQEGTEEVPGTSSASSDGAE